MNRVCASTDCYVYCLWQFFCMCIHSNCKKENSKNKQQEKLSSFRRTMHNCMLVYTVKWNIVYDRKWKEREKKVSSIQNYKRQRNISKNMNSIEYLNYENKTPRNHLYRYMFIGRKSCKRLLSGHWNASIKTIKIEFLCTINAMCNAAAWLLPSIWYVDF